MSVSSISSSLKIGAMPASARAESLPPSMDEISAQLLSKSHEASEAPLPPSIDELTGIKGKLEESRSQRERERVAQMQSKLANQKQMGRGMDL